MIVLLFNLKLLQPFKVRLSCARQAQACNLLRRTLYKGTTVLACEPHTTLGTLFCCMLCRSGEIMQRPALAPAQGTAGAATHNSSRRLIVAVVGDSNLDAAGMKPHRAAGDEAVKKQLAEEVSMPQSWPPWPPWPHDV